MSLLYDPEPGTVLYRQCYYRNTPKALCRRYVYLGKTREEDGSDKAHFKVFSIGLNRPEFFSVDLSRGYFTAWYQTTPSNRLLVISGLGIPEELKHEVYLYLSPFWP